MASADPIGDPAALLRASKVFGSLPEQELAFLSSTARIESFKVATLLQSAGEPLEWLRLVLAGHIEISARRASGDEVVLGEMGAGSWALWLACAAEVKPAHDLYSSAKARFLAVSAARVRAVCERHPILYRAIMIEVGARARLILEWTSQSVLLGPEQRLAKLLVVLARTHGIEGSAGTLRITQDRLARLAGCSRDKVNGLVGVLRARELVRGGYGQLRIDDIAALDAFAEAEA